MDARRTVNTFNNGYRAEAGNASVELGILLALLITILLGAIDFGRFAYATITVANAARNGSAYGSTSLDFAAHGDVIAQRALEDAQLLVPTPATSSSIESCDGYYCSVVGVEYQFQTLVDWPLIPNSVSIQQVSRMKIRGP